MKQLLKRFMGGITQQTLHRFQNSPYPYEEVQETAKSIAQELLEERERRFGTYVIENAGQVIVAAPTVDVEVFVDAMAKLADEDFIVFTHNETRIKIMCGFDLLETVVNNTPEPLFSHITSGSTVYVHGVEIHGSQGLPDKEAVVVHEDAVTPANPEDWRPWYVKEPQGVVHIIQKDDVEEL